MFAQCLLRSQAFRHLVAARALLGEKPLDIWQELADEGQPEAMGPWTRGIVRNESSLAGRCMLWVCPS